MNSRETIYAALFSKVSAAAGFITTSRRLRSIDEVAITDCPALFQAQRRETPKYQRGAPTMWTLKVELFLYVFDGEQSPTSGAASTVLNPLLDAIDTALAPDNMTRNECTLGGVLGVSGSCRKAGETEIYEGVGSGGHMTVAIVPIEIITA